MESTSHTEIMKDLILAGWVGQKCFFLTHFKGGKEGEKKDITKQESVQVQKQRQKRWSCVGEERLEGKQVNVYQAGQRLEPESFFLSSDYCIL